MLQVTLDLESDMALEALALAKEKGQDIKDFLVDMARKGMAVTTRAELLEQPTQPRGLVSKKARMNDALDRVRKDVKPGEEFRLQDLYDQDDWAKISGPTSFGRQFRLEVEGKGLAKHVRKNGANQAIYQRL